VKSTSLLGVVDKVAIIDRCPVLEMVTIVIRFLIAPIRVVAVKIVDHYSWMKEHR
jgi:hypothetical protein